MKKIAKVFTILFTFILLANCETDNFVSSQDSKVATFKSSFSLDNFEDTSNLIKQNIEINWTNYTKASFNNIEYYEFDVLQKSKIRFQANGIDAVIEYKLIGFLNEDNNPDFMLIKAIPYKNDVVFTYLDTHEYDGMVYMYNLDGIITLVEAYKKGELIQKIENTDVLQFAHFKLDQGCVQDKSFTTGITTKSDCNLDGGCGIEPLVTTTYMVYYDVTFNNAGDIINVQYSHTETIGQTTEYIETCGSPGNASITTVGTIGDNIDQESLEEFLEKECGEGYTVNENGECVEQLPPYPHCSSFEYASGLNGAIKAAAVINLQASFAREIVNESGKIEFQYVKVNFRNTPYYFTMPGYVRNGPAATITAIAVWESINEADAYWEAHPEISEHGIGEIWKSMLNRAMGRIGGAASKIPPFTITKPGVYATSTESTGNCN